MLGGRGGGGVGFLCLNATFNNISIKEKKELPFQKLFCFHTQYILCYRQVYDGDENRDKRMQCTFNILVSTFVFYNIRTYYSETYINQTFLLPTFVFRIDRWSVNTD